MNLPAGGQDENGSEKDAELEEAYEAEDQLALEDEDDSLPWLEDDGDYEDEGGFDARLIWFALIGLLVIAALLFGGWWLLRDRPDPALMADGSTIEAPDGPYKERPEDPGGREVEGTGDTAFEVAEGQSTRGLIADEDELAAPSLDLSQTGEDGDADGGGEEAAASSDAVYVQIGAFTSRSDAQEAWVNARDRYSALSGLRNRIVEAEVNGATVYRLQAIAPNREAGDSTCRAIRNAGGDCYIR